MKINGGIRFVERGITASIRAMHVDSELISITNENITGFDKVGYQRKDAVVSSMTEFLGVHLWTFQSHLKVISKLKAQKV